MLLLYLALLLLCGSINVESGKHREKRKKELLKKIATVEFPKYLPEPTVVQELIGVAHFGDGENRGPPWYDFSTDESKSKTDLDIAGSDSSSISSESRESTSFSKDASSVETASDERLLTRAYRVCRPCPQDMLKRHVNIGIKWICGKYQRARRTFKSECMMRYRNCEDGTMFTKISDVRCEKDPYHGRHWFYEYRV